MMEFRPYSKADQLKGHQKEKDTPNFKERRYNRKRKQTKRVTNEIKPPSRYSRGQFSMEDKQKIDEMYGHACLVCVTPYIEYHHCKFLSGLGRGVWRNGVPLCGDHHRLDKDSPHQNEKTAETYRQHKLKIFGPYYYMDTWDLYKKGLIPNTTKEAYESFMAREEENAESVRAGKDRENSG